MLLNATRPAAYSVFPLAREFHTITIAIQRANPIRMRPVIYSGYPERNTMARINIKIGPRNQFKTRDALSRRKFRNTSPSSSYFTFASGGYIIRMSPKAMGRFVVPTWPSCIRVAILGI